MSQARLFTIIGDRNVTQNMTTLNMASRVAMQKAQVIPCPALQDFPTALNAVRPESAVLVYAGITDHLMAAPEGNTIQSTIDPVLCQIRQLLFEFCLARSGVQVILAPPLYRSRPYWYRQQLPEVAELISGTFGKSHPPNFHILPSFINQDSTDGILLTPVAGLHYVLHVFDKSEAVLAELALAAEDVLVTVREEVRTQSDRLAFIEHDHSQLYHAHSYKAAKDAEFNDWVENRSEEDWLTVQGLPRLTGVSDSEWQVAAKRQVRDLIKTVQQVNRVNFSFEIVYIFNPKKGRPAGPTLYNVRLGSFETARRVRDLWSGFFRRNNPLKLPVGLKGVSIRNKVTLATRVRIAIMRQLGANYQQNNPGYTDFPYLRSSS